MYNEYPVRYCFHWPIYKSLQRSIHFSIKTQAMIFSSNHPSFIAYKRIGKIFQDFHFTNGCIRRLYPTSYTHKSQAKTFINFSGVSTCSAGHIGFCSSRKAANSENDSSTSHSIVMHCCEAEERFRGIK